MSPSSTFVVSEELEFFISELDWEYIEDADESQAFSDDFDFLDREFEGYDFERPLKLDTMIQIIKEADGYYFWSKPRS